MKNGIDPTAIRNKPETESIDTAIRKKAAAVAMLSVASNTVLVVLKLIVGILMGSVSVISEAIHSGIDLLAAVIALFAVRQSNKPADEDHPYGHGKFENISGTIEAFLIFVAAGWIIFEASHKFKTPQAVEQPGWGVALMLISSIVNLLVSELLFRVGKKAQSIALEADAWHLRTDVYTSLGVMAGLLAIWIAGKFFPEKNLNWIDPAAALFVALLIIKAAYDLTLQAARDLFDVSLPAKELDWIKALLRSNPEVKGFHHLKTRKAGRTRFIEFHLVIDQQATLVESHQLTHVISAKIKMHFQGSDVIIHMEPCDQSCSPACLSGCFIKVAGMLTGHMKPSSSAG